MSSLTLSALISLIIVELRNLYGRTYRLMFANTLQTFDPLHRFLFQNLKLGILS